MHQNSKYYGETSERTAHFEKIKLHPRAKLYYSPFSDEVVPREIMQQAYQELINGRKYIFANINGIKTRLYRPNQRSHHRLLTLEGHEIKDQNAIKTLYRKRDGHRILYFVVINGQTIQVTTAIHHIKHRSLTAKKKNLYCNDMLITDADILATHSEIIKGNKVHHYVEIDGKVQRVYNEAQKHGQRLYLANGKALKNPEVLSTLSCENHYSLHRYVILNGEKTEVFTAKQRSDSRLFTLDGELITDQVVLASHYETKFGRRIKHLVLMNQCAVEVLTAKQKRDRDLFYDGELIIDKEVIATRKEVRCGRQLKTFVTFKDGKVVEVITRLKLQRKRKS